MPIIGLRHRLLRHAWVLGAAGLLPVVAPHSMMPVASIPALMGLAGGDAIQVSAITGHPSAVMLPNRPAETVVVRPGDTLSSLASVFRADVGALRWANSIVTGSDLVPGTPILVPPGGGALIPVNRGERPSAFAARLGLATRVVLDYNRLRQDAPRPEGSYLQIPVEAAPPGALGSSNVEPIAPGVPAVAADQYRAGGPGSSSGRFPWGQCTWYVSTRRVVPWSGNAIDWYLNARHYGRPEGRTPVAGAIAVIATNWVGHVAYVEKVSADGSFVVSEEHYPGLGVLDERTVTIASLDLVGFIY